MSGLIKRLRMEQMAAEDERIQAEASEEFTSAPFEDAAQVVEDDAGEIETIGGEIQDAESAQDEIEDIQGSVQEAIDSGEGLTPVESEQIQARLESIARKLNIDVSEMGVTFRRESFGKRSPTQEAQLRMEGLGAFADKIGTAINQGFRAFSTMIGDYFTGVERFEKSSAEDIAKLEARINGMSGEANLKSPTLRVGDTFASNEGNNINTAIEMIEGTKDFIPLANKVFDFAANEVGNLKMSEDIDFSTEVANRKKNVDNLAKQFEKESGGWKAETDKKDVQAIPSFRLPNGSGIALIKSGRALGDGSVTVDTFSIGVVPSNHKKGETFAAPSRAELEKLLGSLKTSQGALAGYKQLRQKSLDIAKSYDEAINSSNEAKRGKVSLWTLEAGSVDASRINAHGFFKDGVRIIRETIIAVPKVFPVNHIKILKEGIRLANKAVDNLK